MALRGLLQRYGSDRRHHLFCIRFECSNYEKFQVPQNLDRVMFRSFQPNCEPVLVTLCRYMFAQASIVLNFLALVLCVVLRNVPYRRMITQVRLLLKRISIMYPFLFLISFVCMCVNMNLQCKKQILNKCRMQATGLKRIKLLNNRDRIRSRMFSPKPSVAGINQTPLLETESSDEEQGTPKFKIESPEKHRNRWFQLGSKRGGFVFSVDIQFVIGLLSTISTFLLHLGATLVAPSVVFTLLPLYCACPFVMELCFDRLEKSAHREKTSLQKEDDDISQELMYLSPGTSIVYNSVNKTNYARIKQRYSLHGIFMILLAAILTAIPGLIPGDSSNAMWPKDYSGSSSLGVLFIFTASIVNGWAQIRRRVYTLKELRRLAYKDNATLEPKDRPKHYPDVLRNEMGISFIQMLIGLLLMVLAGLMQDTSQSWCTKNIREPLVTGLWCLAGINKGENKHCLYAPLLFLLQIIFGLILACICMTLHHRDTVYDVLTEHFSLRSAWRARVAAMTHGDISSQSPRSLNPSTRRTEYCAPTIRPGAVIVLAMPIVMLLGFFVCYGLELATEPFSSSPGAASGGKLAAGVNAYFIPCIIVAGLGLGLMQRGKGSKTEGSTVNRHPELDKLFFDISSHECREDFIGSPAGSWFRLAHIANLTWLFGMRQLHQLKDFVGNLDSSPLNVTTTHLPLWKNSLSRRIISAINEIIRHYKNSSDRSVKDHSRRDNDYKDQEETNTDKQVRSNENTSSNGTPGTPIPSLQDMPGIHLSSSQKHGG